MRYRRNRPPNGRISRNRMPNGRVITRPIVGILIVSPQNNMEFSNSFLILQKEGYLIRSALTSGLTALRNSNIGNKENYYTGFFELAIGLERLMKTIIIINLMAKDGLSESVQLNLRKEFDHNLLDLYTSCTSLSQLLETTKPFRIKPASIEYTILGFLSDFANQDRYHNLNILTGNNRTADPLNGWNEILETIITKHLSKKRLDSILEKSLPIASMLSKNSFVLAHGLDDKQINIVDMLVLPQLQDIGAKYAVFHIMNLLAQLKGLLENVTHIAVLAHSDEQREKPIVPFMGEFLDFIWLDKRYILRKKRWP
jgi:hypothetical protein